MAHSSYPDIVLASSSPRRRDMLADAGINFVCLASGVDEDVPAGTPPIDEVTLLSSRKSHSTLDALGGDDAFPIVSCDTIVVLGSEVFGKPADAQDASRMLHALSGQTHKVASGVSILYRGEETAFTQVTEVTFKNLSDAQIDEYIAKEQPFDKAGAYAIQGPAGEFVEKLEGDYNNVVGLPLAKTLQALATMDAGRMDKPAVRKRMKAVRNSIPKADRVQASVDACRVLMGLPEFEASRVIAAYCAFGSELCFDEMAREFPSDKVLVIPVSMPDRHMEFVKVSPDDILPGASKLAFLAKPSAITTMPEGFEIVDPSEIDLMLAPGLAFDEDGYRMGYGGGYYDVYQKRPGFAAKVFGAYFEQQLFGGSIPHDDNDVSLPAIVTQCGVRRIR